MLMASRTLLHELMTAKTRVVGIAMQRETNA
jgi:hypothetical protein